MWAAGWGTQKRELEDDGLGTKRPDISTSGWILGDKPVVRDGERARKGRRSSHDRAKGARRRVARCVCARTEIELNLNLRQTSPRTPRYLSYLCRFAIYNLRDLVRDRAEVTKVPRPNRLRPRAGGTFSGYVGGEKKSA